MGVNVITPTMEHASLATCGKSEHVVDNKFQKLVQDLKDALGPSSGLTCDDIDLDALTDLMRQYDSKPNEWKEYFIGDESKGYTRNLVDEGNGKSNLLVLVWSPGKGSAIHDHGNAHCLMKILSGDLTETRYAFPEGETSGPMQVLSEKVYKENAVAYMADELGVHRIMNNGTKFAVSLHLYTPPNVAKEGCNVFDQSTGKSSHIAKCGYHSVYGRVLEE
ncbi:hypothetical protein TD95_005053 [Thielaviopsis punctulata]|uniref:Cysteine dioxygenase n=1 Tax=Thielaviopsis punctulata TaxID=72032 RepID=A0A0F4ZL14_9PEZI|nr:hypothetical protein TD95_005053 [Thielaviopsis punctulata]